MKETNQGPPPLCSINSMPVLPAGPIFLVLLSACQVYQVAEADVLVGSCDEVITDHREKSHDLIWETLKRFRCNVIVRVQTQK